MILLKLPVGSSPESWIEYNIPDIFTNLHKHKYDNSTPMPTVCTLLEEEEEILLYDSCTDSTANEC